MTDRNHLERLLRINGVVLPAPDDSVRAVLASAHFNESEIRAALVVLQSTVPTKESQPSSEGAQKLLHTDQRLSAREISQLLGIDVVIPVHTKRQPKPERMPPQIMVTIAVLSVLVAFIGVGLAMFFMEVGVFHATAASSTYGW
jgi:hypothetical protein